MKIAKHILFVVFLFATIQLKAQFDINTMIAEKPDGFASLNGGTTGGYGGRIVYVTSLDSLKDLMDSDEKLVLLLEGTFQLSGMTTCRSNKTLIGIGAGATLQGGGLEFYKKTNVIIRNILFSDAQDDCIKINQNTTNFWVDHCTFTDGTVADPEAASHDGLLDITRCSNYITVTYCEFINHSKDILIGMSDGYDQDIGYLKVTFHHNWFNATRQRHPRVRYGTVHCYNNYYLNNELYGVASCCEADVLVEANYFSGIAYPSYCGYAESPAGDLVERYNIYDNSGTPQTRGSAFEASTYYTYTLDSASTVPATVMAKAGAGKLTAIGKSNNMKPETTLLMQNYPNPFNPQTSIEFQLAKAGNVTLKVFDNLGNEIKTVINEVKPAGSYNYFINMGDCSSGIYFYRLSTNGYSTTKKMLLLK
jgi:pectate lyase